MHSKNLIIVVLQLLATFIKAFPAVVDGAKTGLAAFNNSFVTVTPTNQETSRDNSEADNLTVGGALSDDALQATESSHSSLHLSSRDSKPHGWRDICAWWPDRAPGSVIQNEKNENYNLVSDCSRQTYSTLDSYVVRINMEPSWHTATCACDWFHFYLKKKTLGIVASQIPQCWDWNNGNGIEIVFKAYKGRVGSVNWALEQVYGFRFTCRVGTPKTTLGGAATPNNLILTPGYLAGTPTELVTG